ncbi:Protein-L-isoaspartate(D-aspartate) O-methyltransferase [Thioalkalivibrio sp. K90mix]|jgi:protein-L-isoaspartate(D-aspartate) O-methyltransferase|uniref:protein-L-isoaspartate O-methyltransferase family protein n=1 Tax=unclassified Thioalkalivibrio TaxID=2621013 RepID=UPI000195A300|nr:MULTISPECIES: protein-L-isoaspartate O-methyltransferase [unclassified Thioalkalivibrio]ADC72946.1 Protein-L-isoaspartate(D-aspartate) O-methyltransferase [Thioalkalivibrio sp. K90mix]
MDFALARMNMVEQQVRPWDVLDMRVLDVMETLPRERFMPDAYKALAYADSEIPLGHGAHTLPPVVIGRLLQAAAPQPTETVLEIGTGSGYVTACLARLAAHVDSIERIDELRLKARNTLVDMGLENTSLRTATVTPEWAPPRERYDVIVLTGAMTEYNDFLERYLTLGGRLFVITGDGPIMQANLITRTTEDSVRHDVLFETRVEPLVGFEPKPAFEF